MKKITVIFAGLIFGLCVFSVQPVNGQENTARLLNNLETHSDRFSRLIDKAMDKSSINGTSTEGEFTRYIKQYEDATDRLKRNWDKKKEVRIAFRDVYGRARSIDRIMRRYKFSQNAETEWITIRNILTRIARSLDERIRW